MGYVVTAEGNFLRTNDSGVAGRYVVTSDTTLISLINPPAVNATVGTPYSSSFTPGGTGPYTYLVVNGALPGGLTLGAGTGTISGTPNTVGNFTFDVQVTDNLQGTQINSMTIFVTSAMAANSGIYKLIPNQTHDTYYVSLADPDNPTTTNVKIPNPFAETAFIDDEEI